MQNNFRNRRCLWCHSAIHSKSKQRRLCWLYYNIKISMVTVNITTSKQLQWRNNRLCTNALRIMYCTETPHIASQRKSQVSRAGSGRLGATSWSLLKFRLWNLYVREKKFSIEKHKIFILQQCLNPNPNFFFGFGSSQNIRIISDSDPQHWQKVQNLWRDFGGG
jgi:hypothetical protein